MSGGRIRLLALLAGLVLLAGCSTPSASPVSGVPGVGNISCTNSTGNAPGLDAEQTGNARIIISVAYSLGLGDAGAKVAVTAAMTESSLRNVGHGDTLGPDSIGLFQQRDPWGPLSVRTDPAGATNLFFTADKGPGVRGLIHFPGWQNMDIPTAAQKVEGSEFSGGQNYAANTSVALAAVATLAPGCTAQVGTGNAQVGKAGLAALMNPSQDPSSFGWVRAGQMEPLTWQGRSLGSVAAGTAALWMSFLDQLIPMIPGGMNSNVGCFDDRNNVNNPSAVSFHAYGLACDINSDANPNGAAPAGLQGQFVVPGAAQQLAHQYGMEWGGEWTGVPDPMHFELHLTPQQVAAATAGKAV